MFAQLRKYATKTKGALNEDEGKALFQRGKEPVKLQRHPAIDQAEDLIPISWTPSGGVVFLEGAPVQFHNNFHGNRITQGPMGEATVLGKFHQLANSLWRFIRVDLDPSLKTCTAALNGTGQDRALSKETRGLLNASLPEPDLCGFPGPGKLGKQSESNAGAKVGQRVWCTVVAADPNSLVAQNREAAPRRSPLAFTPYFRPLLLPIERPGTHTNANLPIGRGVCGSGSRGRSGIRRSLF